MDTRARSRELAAAAAAFVADRDVQSPIPAAWYREFAAAHGVRDLRTATRHIATAVRQKCGELAAAAPAHGTPRPQAGAPPRGKRLEAGSHVEVRIIGTLNAEPVSAVVRVERDRAARVTILRLEADNRMVVEIRA